MFCCVFIFCLIYSACALTALRHCGDGNDDDDDGDDGNSQIKFTVMKMLNLVQNITTTWDVMGSGFTMRAWRIMTSEFTNVWNVDFCFPLKSYVWSDR